MPAYLYIAVLSLHSLSGEKIFTEDIKDALIEAGHGISLSTILSWIDTHSRALRANTAQHVC